MESGVETIETEKRALLRRLARVGLPEFQIAFSIGVRLETLQTFYGPLLEEAKIGVNLHVLETLERLARSGKAVGATIFWTRSQCKWAIAAARKSFAEKIPQPLDPEIIVSGPNGELE